MAEADRSVDVDAAAVGSAVMQRGDHGVDLGRASAPRRVYAPEAGDAAHRFADRDSTGLADGAPTRPRRRL